MLERTGQSIFIFIQRTFILFHNKNYVCIYFSTFTVIYNFYYQTDYNSAGGRHYKTLQSILVTIVYSNNCSSSKILQVALLFTI